MQQPEEQTTLNGSHSTVYSTAVKVCNHSWHFQGILSGCISNPRLQAGLMATGYNASSGADVQHARKISWGAGTCMARHGRCALSMFRRRSCKVAGACAKAAVTFPREIQRPTGRNMDGQANRQTTTDSMDTYKQTSGQAAQEADRQRDRQTCGRTGSDKQRDRQTTGQPDRQADRKTAYLHLSVHAPASTSCFTSFILTGIWEPVE